MTREQYADHILARLNVGREAVAAEFATPDVIRSAIIDDLLPEKLAREIFEAFPAVGDMQRRDDLRESKYYSAQLDRYDTRIEEIVYAFQDPRVVAIFSELTGIEDLQPDPRLYAGGISAMVEGSFLNPHLDNSHDGKRERYRVLNSLFYLTPGWGDDNGGHLELWDRGTQGPSRTIHSRFNRLVLMETNRRSWHSVSPVVVAEKRTCVSNYFFRDQPVTDDYFHATSFRGRPGQNIRDVVLRADNALRTAVLSVVNVPNKHIYKK